MRLTSVSFKLLAFAVLTLFCILPASTSTRALAQSSTYAQQCSAGNAQPVVAYAYWDGWLLCDTADAYTGAEQLYQETALGSGIFNLGIL
jgi:hypothetical protein